MKLLNSILITVTITLSVFSIFYLVSSLDLLNKLDSFTAGSVYNILSKYSGLYKFTFVALAALLTLRQFQLAQLNSKQTLNQIQFTQEDIVLKRQKEANDETLYHCKSYFTEIQTTLKESSINGVLDLMPVKWDFLNSVSSDSLRENDYFFKLISERTETHKKEILMALHQFEAFSALFVRGNLDLKLGKEIIGSMFCGQMDLWFGFIAMFRKNDKSEFCQNLLELHRKWEF